MTGEIIGREHELDVVRAFLDRQAEGLTALLLKGEPGIGKSTICQAGVAAARERSFRVLTSRPAETERTLPCSAACSRAVVATTTASPAIRPSTP